MAQLCIVICAWGTGYHANSRWAIIHVLSSEYRCKTTSVVCFCLLISVRMRVVFHGVYFRKENPQPPGFLFCTGQLCSCDTKTLTSVELNGELASVSVHVRATTITLQCKLQRRFLLLRLVLCWWRPGWGERAGYLVYACGVCMHANTTCR